MTDEQETPARDYRQEHRQLSRKVMAALQALATQMEAMALQVSGLHDDRERLLWFLDGTHTAQGADVMLGELNKSVIGLESRMEKSEKEASKLRWWLFGVFSAVIAGIAANFPILMKHIQAP